MSFGFGALPGFANMRPEDVASLFSPAPSGAPQGFGVLPQAPAGFSGSVSRGIAPFGALPAPPVAMDEAETQRLEAGMMPAAAPSPRMSGAPTRSVSLPAPNTAPEASAGGMVNPPLPPRRPAEFGSNSDDALQAPAPPVPGAGAEPPGMMDRFLSGIKSGLGGIDSDLLMGLGIGLMSQRGFGPGAAAGLQMGTQMQNSRAARDLAGAKQAVELQRLRQAQGNTQQIASLIQRQNPGMTPEQAQALAATPAYANKAVEAMLPPSEQYASPEKDADGNLVQRDTRTNRATLLKSATDDKLQLVDVTLPNGQTQKVWMKPGEAAGVPVGQPGMGAGGTVDAQVEARRRSVQAMGQDPNDARWRDFILSGSLPKENQQQLTASDKQAIMEGEDKILSHRSAIGQLQRAQQLSADAYDGVGASGRALLESNIPSMFGGPTKAALATREFDNVMSSQMLDSLKSIFGGNPTEGERAALRDIQGISSMPRDLRDKVIANALEKVQRRLGFEEQRVNDLRGGSYYKPGGGLTAVAPASNSAGPVRVSSPDEARKLPKGTPIILPDGSQGVVP